MSTGLQHIAVAVGHRMYVENDLVAPTAGLPLPVRHRVLLYSTKDVKGATM